MDLEKIIMKYISKVQVTIPCKIEKIHNDMYADVKPVIDTIKLNFPVIPNVPICTIGNNTNKIKFKSQVGDIVLVLFSQLDFSKFLIEGLTEKTDNEEVYNLTNAIALPFNPHIKGSEVLASSDFEITGNIKLTGNIEMSGDIELSGNVTVTTGDVIADGISLKTHTHPYTWTDGPGAGNTGTPT